MKRFFVILFVLSLPFGCNLKEKAQALADLQPVACAAKCIENNPPTYPKSWELTDSAATKEYNMNQMRKAIAIKCAEMCNEYHNPKK